MSSKDGTRGALLTSRLQSTHVPRVDLRKLAGVEVRGVGAVGCRMKISRLLAGAAPFVLVVLVHYVRFASVSLHGTQPAHPARRLRLHHSEPAEAAAMRAQEPSEPPATRLARLEDAAVVGEAAAARLKASRPSAASSLSSADKAAAVAEAATRRAKCESYSSHVHALSSSDATGKMLACAGLLPEPGVGLSEVLTADRIHALLPPDSVVYLTFCNYAYLHFAQNWWSQVHRHPTRSAAHVQRMCSACAAHVRVNVHAPYTCAPLPPATRLAPRRCAPLGGMTRWWWRRSTHRPCRRGASCVCTCSTFRSLATRVTSEASVPTRSG